MNDVRRYTYKVDPVYDRASLTPIGSTSEHFAPTGQYVSGSDHDAAVNALRDELGAVTGEYDRAVNKVDTLEQRLAAENERADLLEVLLLKATPSKVTKCRECGGTSLTWYPQQKNGSGVQEGRLRTHEVECVFFLGCDECSETLAFVSADKIAASLLIAPLKPLDGAGVE